MPSNRTHVETADDHRDVAEAPPEDGSAGPDPTDRGASPQEGSNGLLHRWLVEYNPFYLLSAALVLVGVTVLARELAEAGSLFGQLGVGLITEIYSVALILGATFLRWLGQRRASAMLGLLTALFLCDPTLHTETCAYLGLPGDLATVGWLGLFVAKLAALGWALELRLTRSAWVVVTVGAAFVAAMPQVLRAFEPAARGQLVGLGVFALAVGALYTPRTVTSRVGFDVRGRRCVRAVWQLFAVALVFHVAFWATEMRLPISCLLPTLLLVGLRFARRERNVWLLGGATLVGVGITAPGFFSSSTVMLAVMLALRALHHPRRTDSGERSSGPASPYRASARPLLVSEAATPVLTFVRASRPARRRLLTGSVSCLILSVWMLGWKGGPFPAPLVVLDVVFAAVLLVGAWRLRTMAPLVPLVATGLHLVLVGDLVPLPATAIGWGGAAVGLGFGVLAAALGASYWASRRHPLP